MQIRSAQSRLLLLLLLCHESPSSWLFAFRKNKTFFRFFKYVVYDTTSFFDPEVTPPTPPTNKPRLRFCSSISFSSSSSSLSAPVPTLILVYCVSLQEVGWCSSSCSGFCSVPRYFFSQMHLFFFPFYSSSISSRLSHSRLWLLVSFLLSAPPHPRAGRAVVVVGGYVHRRICQPFVCLDTKSLSCLDFLIDNCTRVSSGWAIYSVSHE